MEIKTSCKFLLYLYSIHGVQLRLCREGIGERVVEMLAVACFVYRVFLLFKIRKIPYILAKSQHFLSFVQ